MAPRHALSLTADFNQVENVLQGSDGKWKVCDLGSCATRSRAYENKSEIAREEVTHGVQVPKRKLIFQVSITAACRT
jgi:hypothetical protein